MSAGSRPRPRHRERRPSSSLAAEANAVPPPLPSPRTRLLAATDPPTENNVVRNHTGVFFRFVLVRSPLWGNVGASRTGVTTSFASPPGISYTSQGRALPRRKIGLFGFFSVFLNVNKGQNLFVISFNNAKGGKKSHLLLTIVYFIYHVLNKFPLIHVDLTRN